ncbi:MAG: DUF4175 family protein [bacterium]
MGEAGDSGRNEVTDRNVSSGSSPLDTIRLFLRSAEIRLRLWSLLETGLWVAALGCVVLLLGIGARAVREFWPFSPPVYSGLAAGLGIWALALLIWRGFRRIPRDRVAFLIEKRHPELNNALISSVQLAGPGEIGGRAPSAVSASLINALFRRTAAAIQPIHSGDAIDPSRLRRPLQAAGIMAALTLAVGLMGPRVLAGSWDLLLHPIEGMPPRAILIQTKPLSGKTLLGRRVSLRANTSGRRTKTLWVEVSPDGSGSRVVEMAREGEGKFSHRTGPVRASFSYRAFIGSDSSEVQRLEAVPPPAVGEIEVGYAYPSYARLKRKVRKGTGYVRALKGTEVALSLLTNKPVDSGRLVFQSGVEVPLDLSDPVRPRGRFIVMEKDAYRIFLRDRWGFENPDPVQYTVDVVPDLPPSVELLQPQGELTVNGPETFLVRYIARDDFGLKDVRLVAEVSGVGRREIVTSKSDGASRWESVQYEWDLRDLGLRPGAVVRARLVARDNDTISGPKEGVSKTFVIRVRSPEEEHKRVKGLQKKIANRLLNLLGDQLELEADASEKLGESPDGLPQEGNQASGKPDRPNFTGEDAEAFRRRSMKMEETVRNLMAQIDRALSHVARDPRSGFDSFTDLRAMRSNLAYLQRELMPKGRKPLEDQGQSANAPDRPRQGAPSASREARPPGPSQDALRRFRGLQKEITRELERMAVFADDIGKRGRLRDLANLGRRLANAQNRFLDALDRAKKDDSASMRALREALAKLQELMNKLAQGLRNLPIQLPDEFLNMPTSQTLQLDDISRKLREIQRKINAGDLKAARKLAEDLVKSLSRMIAALRGAMQQAMSQAANRFGRSAQRQQNILQQLLNRQRAILDATWKIEKPVQEKFREMQREAFSRAEEKAEKALEAFRRLGRKIPDPSLLSGPPGESPEKKKTVALERSLSRKEIPKAVMSASALGDLSRKVSEALSKRLEEKANVDERAAAKSFRELGDDFDALAAALNNLPKDPRVVLTPEQRERLGELKKDQKEVEEKTVEVRKRVEQIMRVMPFLSPEIAKNLLEAGKAMGKAAVKLGQRRANKAIPPERDAIYWLSRAGSNMRAAMQQMARRGRFGGAPAPSVVQPGGRPTIALQWAPNLGEEERGRMGASTRDFRLPDKGAYKVPKVYREEVVDALKGKYPPAYREQIEQYFKNLVE